ncbi:protein kinase, putative [Trypanosoma cruzi]|uniref:Protein kinase, putative n=1 Tax=Trypanosoma cruzi (strain CL Brener) TaxID=353153 RepID=Q4CWI8_TRYCC|nr:protein kinase, putative [Trypanosoma cruzi]EAN84637.1 protein kinase, putative [Trypanosoma cruzi]|eukprot:XP_806488.1 protein kinase [Trypanosoma cruzi strain CL Brener]
MLDSSVQMYEEFMCKFAIQTFALFCLTLRKVLESTMRSSEPRHHQRKRAREGEVGTEPGDVELPPQLPQEKKGSACQSPPHSRAPPSPEKPTNSCAGEGDSDCVFVPAPSNSCGGGTSGGGGPHQERKLKQATLVSFGLINDASLFRKEIADRDAQIDELRERLSSMESRVAEAESALAASEAQLSQVVLRAEHYQRVLREEMLRTARQAKSDARRALHQKHFELGQIAMWHSSGREVWVEGNRPKELIMQLEELSSRRDEVEELKKAAEKRVRQLVRSSDEDSMTPELQSALMESQEAMQLYTSEFAALGSSIQAVKQRQLELDHEKKAFLKEIRRVSDEDASEFMAVLAIGQGQRYVLMQLLGKGGFSEVWKAFDLQDARYVACKIHRVQREWSAQTRLHYRRHADRELAIMRTLQHPHLTRLYDEFEHGEAMFVSVMEYSQGADLDTHLKRYGCMREMEARLILLQVVSALRYLAAQEQPIIHYDLKPANILFHSSNASSLEIKITDFGLSKLIQSRDGPHDNPTIELTSQGTGTYWYLPPECFDTVATPRISNKVDVWSCGIIFYQMLFGRRPFAEGESQRRIWQDKLIVSSARTLRFPDTPRVSQEAKDLIQKCLEYHPSDRYDVHQLSQDSYLQRTSRRSTRSERPSSLLLPPSLPSSALAPTSVAEGKGDAVT